MKMKVDGLKMVVDLTHENMLGNQAWKVDDQYLRVNTSTGKIDITYLSKWEKIIDIPEYLRTNKTNSCEKAVIDGNSVIFSGFDDLSPGGIEEVEVLLSDSGIEEFKKMVGKKFWEMKNEN